jgi:hypothetical protein
MTNIPGRNQSCTRTVLFTKDPIVLRRTGQRMTDTLAQRTTKTLNPRTFPSAGKSLTKYWRPKRVNGRHQKAIYRSNTSSRISEILKAARHEY